MDHLHVGVLNDHQLTVALNKCAAGKQIHFKDVNILKFSGPSGLPSCNVLFVPKRNDQ